MRLDDILSRRTKETFAQKGNSSDTALEELINLWRRKLLDILSTDEVHRRDLQGSNKTIDDILAVFDHKIREGVHPGNAFYAGILAVRYVPGSRAEELSLMNWGLIMDLARKEVASYGHPPEKIDGLIVSRFAARFNHSNAWEGNKDWSEEYVVRELGSFAPESPKAARRHRLVDPMHFLDRALAAVEHRSGIPGINEFVEGLLRALPEKTRRGNLERLLVILGGGWRQEAEPDGSIWYYPQIPLEGELSNIAGSAIRVFPDGTYKIRYSGG